MLGDRIGGKNALALCLLIGAVNTAFLLLARMFWVLVVFTFVGGITGSAPIALGPMVQVETLGLRRYGSIAGLLGIAFTLGATMGPPIVGRLADATGTYTVSFEVCALVAVVGAVASFLCVAPAPAQGRVGRGEVESRRYSSDQVPVELSGFRGLAQALAESAGGARLLAGLNYPDTRY